MIPISTKFLGVKLSLMNREELKEFLIQTLYEKKKFRIMILDERKMFKAFFDKEFRQVINSTDIVLCSSQTVVWSAKLLTNREVPLIMPVTLLLDLMRVAEEMHYTVFIYGGDKNVNIEAVKRARKSFPNARIVGNYHFRIKGKELDDVLIAIRKSSPQIFFGSLGGGSKQEKWLSSQEEYLKKSVIVGVDTAFNIIAGREKMPPIRVQQKGRIGLYRSLTHPYNIVRFFRIATIFFVTLYNKLFKKK